MLLDNHLIGTAGKFTPPHPESLSADALTSAEQPQPL